MQNLDGLLDESDTIGVLKMDVQGSELSVLHGMTRLLDRHAARDIVFEELAPYPAPTHECLKSKGIRYMDCKSDSLEFAVCQKPNLVSIR